MKLTLEQNAYFDEMNAMFMSEAWRLFQDDVKGWYDALLGSYDSVEDPREMGVIQGRRNMALQVLNYQEVIEQGRKSLEDAPEPLEQLEPDV